MTKIWRQAEIIAPGGSVFNITGTAPLWLATEAGILRQGKEWRPPFQPLSEINALAAHEEFLLAGNRHGQIVYSRDGGQTWRGGHTGGNEAAITGLVLAPDFPQSGVALAATHGAGILRTTDSGHSWQPANFGLQDFSILMIAVPPRWKQREIVFAASQRGIYRSANGGRAWKKIGPEQAIQVLAVGPRRTLLAGTEEGQIFRSNDGGKNWQTSQPLEEPAPINALWSHPGRPVWVAATGDGRILHSADEGRRWQETARPGQPVLGLGGDERQLYAGLYKAGLLRSDDGGQTWESVPNLPARLLTRLQSAADRLLAYGPPAEIWRAEGLSRQWKRIPLPPKSFLITMCFIPGSDGGLLAATTAGLLRREADETAWQTVLPDIKILKTHFDGQRLWAGSAFGQLFVSDDGGQSWTERPGPKKEHSILGLTADETGMVVAALNQDDRRLSLWRSADEGQSWQRWHQTEPLNRPVTELVRQGQTTLLAFDNEVWIEQGTGWEKAAALGEPMVRLIPTGDKLLLLTAHRLLVSVDGHEWQPWDEGLRDQPKQDLILLSQADGQRIALALTAGGILWQRPL